MRRDGGPSASESGHTALNRSPTFSSLLLADINRSGPASVVCSCALGLSTLQAARFYVPALGAIALCGAWLLVRVPRSQPLAAITLLAVVAALFWLGGRAFHDMHQFPFGSQLVVVPGPGGTVELKPSPGAMIGAPGRVAPGGRGRAAQMQPAAG